MIDPALLTSAWAAKRRNQRGLAVSGLTDPAPENPNLAQRRALAIAKMLRQEGISPFPARTQGASFRLGQSLSAVE